MQELNQIYLRPAAESIYLSDPCEVPNLRCDGMKKKKKILLKLEEQKLTYLPCTSIAYC